MGDSQQPGDRSMQPRVSMDMSGSMQMEHIGYQPDYSVIANQRRKLRSVMDSLWFESVVIVLVLVYAVILIIDMIRSSTNAPDPQICLDSGPTPADVLRFNASLAEVCSLGERRDALYFLDLIFLAIFIGEICIRLIGYGLTFLREAVQAIDCLVVVLAFITALLPKEVHRQSTT